MAYIEEFVAQDNQAPAQPVPRDAEEQEPVAVEEQEPVAVEEQQPVAVEEQVLAISFT
jgi:hypothetical protein